MPISKENKTTSVNKIVGRLREQELLRELIESKKAEFVAVYGRRRIGKTYLIKNFINQIPCKFFHVTGLQKGSLKDQLEEFSIQFLSTFFEGAPQSIPKKRWRDAFQDLTDAIAKLPKEQKVLLFFDEFPWMLRHEADWKSCLHDETTLAVA